MIFPGSRLSVIERLSSVDPDQDVTVLAVDMLTEPGDMKRFAQELICGMRRDSAADEYEHTGSLMGAGIEWVGDRRSIAHHAVGHILLRALDHSGEAFNAWYNVLEQNGMWPPKLPEGSVAGSYTDEFSDV